MTNYLPALLALCALTANAAEPPAAKPAAPTGAGAPKYVQAPSGSNLSFTFTQLDAASTGQFKTFVTQLVYDEKNPALGSLDVKVTVSSLDTQDEERDQALKEPDLFDAQKFPTARISC